MTARLLEDLDTETFGFDLLAEDGVSFAENMRLFPGDAAQAASGWQAQDAAYGSDLFLEEHDAGRFDETSSKVMSVDIVVTL